MENQNNIKPVVSIVKTAPSYEELSRNGAMKNALLDLLGGLNLSKQNPFGEYVKAGQTVLIKPNWVREANPLGYDLDSLITHTVLIKEVINLLAIALGNRGKIVMADAPLQKCNFEILRQRAGIDDMLKEMKLAYPNISFVIEDWRITTLNDVHSKDKEPQKIKNDVSDSYVVYDLGKESFLEEISEYADRFRVTDYKPSLMRKHHGPGKHEYAITKRVFDVDFIINLPKMKTHMKTGITCAMKNLVGINGHKEFLPHHIKGSFLEGGDCYMAYNPLRKLYENLYDYMWENLNFLSVWKRKILIKVMRYLLLFSRIGKENIQAGSWRGNDTIWRTVIDLNHILYFHSKKQRKVLNIVDGIIAGEKQGPLSPTPKPIGILIAGENPAYIDAVAAKMMGYNIFRIPMIYNAIYSRRSKFGGV